eukprot:g39567.t1
MVGDRKVLPFVAYRAQMLLKTVSKSTLGLTDVEETTSGATDTEDQIDGCAGDMKGLFWALDGGEVVVLGQVVEVVENDTLDVEVGGVICDDKEDSFFISGTKTEVAGKAQQ